MNIAFPGLDNIFTELVKDEGVLQRLFGKGILRGNITQRDRTPIADVKIIIRQHSQELIETTTFRGTYIFTRLRGKYSISLEFSGRTLSNFDVIYIKGGQEIEMSIQLSLEEFLQKDETSQPNVISREKNSSRTSLQDLEQANFSTVVNEVKKQLEAGSLFDSINVNDFYELTNGYDITEVLLNVLQSVDRLVELRFLIDRLKDTDQAVQIYEKTLDSPGISDRLRIFAIDGLGLIGGSKHLPSLQRYVNDENRSLKRAARKAISSILSPKEVLSAIKKNRLP